MASPSAPMSSPIQAFQFIDRVMRRFGSGGAAVGAEASLDSFSGLTSGSPVSGIPEFDETKGWTVRRICSCNKI
eukprot:CAMPEP_0197324376 /NCGR_PEP_ID=MMETSP0891-20130614/71068_1 /TAXON_ID=44058 ORGANISM="Aureoumbra lagunensis, Strain CCMP1510" /NCGR_SAMPLE_ID=MMETSP0891 /ASSEMBLY_ACC=CAM_ASM_000534 /LENGTH=73 /DNA_ID=CAMNT_0042817175 /DNA_START=556 /DNA_END=774 /DNA_ORIENTATION=-